MAIKLFDDKIAKKCTTNICYETFMNNFELLDKKVLLNQKYKDEMQLQESKRMKSKEVAIRHQRKFAAQLLLQKWGSLRNLNILRHQLGPLLDNLLAKRVRIHIQFNGVIADTVGELCCVVTYTFTIGFFFCVDY